jgi:dUTP pyrophosphatase
MNKLYVQTVHEEAFVPYRATPGSAGYDLSSCETVNILPYSTVLVSTGIKLAIPKGHYGRIAPRSGVSVKKQLIVNAGVIDEDYRGVVKIVFFNPTPNIVEISSGEKVAQLLIEKVSYPEVEHVESLDETERGANGFGSTGI